MATEYLTSAQIAKTLGLAESTVRYYRDRYAAYIPSHGVGRSKRYEPAAVEVLRFIAETMRANVPHEEVESRLAARFPMTMEAEPPDDTVRESQQQLAATQQQTAAALQALVEQAVARATAPLVAELAATRTEREQIQEALTRQAEVLGVERGRRQALEAELERIRAISAAPPKFVAAHHAISAELRATRERVIAALRDLDRAEGENAKLWARQGHWWAFWRRRGDDQRTP